MSLTRTCIICRTRLSGPHDGVRFIDPLEGGMVCSTTGGYGSGIFDSSQIVLEFYICDTCTEERAEYFNSYYVRTEQTFWYKAGIHHSVEDLDPEDLGT